ncbi:unnamed protein product [Ectocarpus fasciculatus]
MSRGVNKSGLMLALVRGRLKDVIRMLAAGASIHAFREEHSIHPIAVAAAHGHVHIIKALVARGADIEASSWAESNGYCCCGGNPDWPYMNGFTALHIAATLGKVQTMLVLLQLGANPNASDTKGATPMMVACRAGVCCGPSAPTQREMLDALLKAGADPALEDEDGRLAIHIAAFHCETKVVEMLLSKAPSTRSHATHDGSTPLAAAAEGGNESTMALLLSWGASDLWAWAEKGVNSLNVAAQRGMAGSVRFLLKNGLGAVGGEPAIADAMLYSVVCKHVDILEILLNVEGAEKQEVWANQSTNCHPLENHSHYERLWGEVPVHDIPEARAVLATKFGSPLLHVAAMHCSIPALRVLLSAGANTEKTDPRGELAKDKIGQLLSDDERNVDEEAAARKILLKGPAFRARSWAWPATTNAALGRASRKAHLSFSTPVPQTPMRVQIFKQTDEKLFSRSFDW